MACHTWFHKKVERTMEEARTLFIEYQEELIARFNDMLFNPIHQVRIAYNWDDTIIKHQIDVLERQLIIVKKGLCNEAVLNKQEDCIYVPGKGLYGDDGTLPHDLFRTKYSDDQLFSYEETIQYLEDNKDAVCNFHHDVNGKDWKQMLKEFWENNTDGMIHFG
jgi:hypothetical protein